MSVKNAFIFTRREINAYTKFELDTTALYPVIPDFSITTLLF